MSKRFNIKPPIWPREYSFPEFVKLNPHIINENQLITLYNQYLNKYLEETNQKKIHFKQSKITQLLTELKDLKFNDIINLNSPGGGSSGESERNYALSFSGDRAGATDSYATTTFNPDTYSLWNGFTVSFWIKPAQIGGYLQALGRR